jgi:hypothetical protein
MPGRTRSYGAVWCPCLSSHRAPPGPAVDGKSCTTPYSLTGWHCLTLVHSDRGRAFTGQSKGEAFRTSPSARTGTRTQFPLWRRTNECAVVSSRLDHRSRSTYTSMTSAMPDYGHAITFGLSLYPSVDQLRDTRQLAKAADAAGHDYLAIQTTPTIPSSSTCGRSSATYPCKQG